MRKPIAVVLLIVLLLSTHVAYAKDLTISIDGEPQPVPFYTDSSPYYDEEEKLYEQPCYVLVTIIQDQPDGSSTTSTISVHAYTIEYKVVIFTANGGYSGIRLAQEKYPEFTVVEAPSRPVNFTYTKLTYPNISNASWGADYYSATILGGSYDFSYNSTLHYDMYGNLIESDTVRTSSTRAYYYVFSGP